MSMHETELEHGEFGETAELHELSEFGEVGELSEHGEFGEVSEFHEAEEEQFLGGILGSLLGGEVSPLSESQEIELAAELLEISSEEELEQFLGSIFKKVGGFLRSPVARSLGGILKNVAKKALPVVGGALGSLVAPGIGTAIGSKLGSAASGLFEVELEAMPQEHAEFEVARRVVGLTAASARNAAAARPRPGISPQTVARAAVAKAARAYAPGVYRQMLQSLRTAVRPGAPGYRRPAALTPPAPGYRRPAAPGVPQPAAPSYQRPAGRRRRWAFGWPYGVPVGYEPTDVSGGYWAPDAVPEPPVEEPAGWGGAMAGAMGPVLNGGPRMSGRWVRRGRKILLLGL